LHNPDEFFFKTALFARYFGLRPLPPAEVTLPIRSYRTRTLSTVPRFLYSKLWISAPASTLYSTAYSTRRYCIRHLDEQQLCPGAHGSGTRYDANKIDRQKKGQKREFTCRTEYQNGRTWAFGCSSRCERVSTIRRHLDTVFERKSERGKKSNE
jgi:hypothetical protein